MQHLFTYVKTYSWIFLLAIHSLSWTACKKIEQFLTFKINNETSFVIPSAIGINTPYSVPVPDVQTNASQSFENNNTNINKVKDIKLEALKLSITSPSGATFKPVKTIRIYISSEGLGEKKIAYAENIPSTIGNTLTLETTGENVDMYVKQSSYNLRTETIMREAIFQDTGVKAEMTFKVTANL
jgi:hypothetical protein